MAWIVWDLKQRWIKRIVGRSGRVAWWKAKVECNIRCQTIVALVFDLALVAGTDGALTWTW
jgi:hypothetical protein